MNKLSLKLLFISLTVFCSSLHAEVLQYCVPVEKFDFSPFREIKDGKELAYLLLLRPYISLNKEDQGILEAYEFSPDGKTFTGKVSANAHWNDGAPVTAQEAALGIAKGFLFRPIGERVKVVGAENLRKTDTCSGIKIIDAKTFELKFESTIENLTGAVREALSAGSRHNRVWPVRLNKNKLEYLAKNQVSFSEQNSSLLIGGKKIELISSQHCTSTDFTLYPEAIQDSLNSYVGKKNNKAQAITLQTNTALLNLKARQALASWVRTSFQKMPKASGIEGVPSFFLQGEPGYREKIHWDESDNLKLLKTLHLKLGVEIPVFKEVLSEAAKRDNLDVTFVDFPLKNSAVHGQVLSSGIHDGRQIILQDILKWNLSREFLKSAPLTVKGLETIAKKSASTVPPDTSTLQKFENAARAEYSLVPVGRRYVTAYSKKNISINLDWSHSGELVFVEQKR